MKVVFMGTPEFAVPSLERLAEKHTVVAVYARADAASKRGATLIAPPVKVAAQRLGIPVLQPATLRDEDEVARLRALDPDVICVAAYGMILPAEVLEIPAFGCINVHASLLPRHRGAAPIHRAVLEGDQTLGVSIMRMEEGLDTGPYALQRSVAADDRSVEELTRMLADIGAEALLEVLDCVLRDEVRWIPQDDSHATYAAKITRDDVILRPELTVLDALRRVRASTSQAASRLVIGDVPVTVVEASLSQDHLPAGAVSATSKALVVGFSDGALRLDRIRPAGKADMDGAAWVCGARLPQRCTWQGPS